jgi:hypothetical protein
VFIESRAWDQGIVGSVHTTYPSCHDARCSSKFGTLVCDNMSYEIKLKSRMPCIQNGRTLSGDYMPVGLPLAGVGHASAMQPEVFAMIKL